jgi:hypothetical protein
MPTVLSHLAADQRAYDRTVDPALSWLLDSDEPAISVMTRRDLLSDSAGGARPGDGAGAGPGNPRENAAAVLAGPRLTALLSGQQPDGGFGVGFYSKWTGAHWRLVSMVELEIPAHEPRAVAAAETVLAALTPSRRRPSLRNGLPLTHASVWGNALAACSRLGLAADPRVADIASAIISWQWPDGGWNCDTRSTGYRSSFHETLATAWGLHEYASATGSAAAADAASRAAELFLEHRLFRSLRTGVVIDRTWLAPRYPPYWHYDILQALLVLSRMGRVEDPRASEALDELERQRLPDGRWRPRGYWWRPPPSTAAREVVDWGRDGPNEMITLNALRVLTAAGRAGPFPL